MLVLIYSEAFDQIPATMREHLLQRLYDILTGDADPQFAKIAASDRQAILKSCAIRKKPARLLAHSPARQNWPRLAIVVSLAAAWLCEESPAPERSVAEEAALLEKGPHIARNTPSRVSRRIPIPGR